MRWFALAAVLLVPSLVSGGTGDVDLTFGSGGIVTLDLSPFGGATWPPRVVVLHDGALLISASGTINGNFGDLVLARYHPDGTLDTSFGAGGLVDMSLGPGYGAAPLGTFESMDGKLIVAGFVQEPPPAASDFPAFAVRLLSNGTADPSFGNEGLAILPEPSLASSVAFDGHRILVSGSAFDGFGALTITRLDDTGALDTSFGVGGVSTVPGLGYGATAIQADGRILLGASGLSRLLDNGMVDATFGNGGYAPGPVNGFSDSVLALQPSDGRIVATGFVGGPTAVPPGPKTGTLIRYATDGTPDPSFGVGGVAQAHLGDVQEAFFGLLLKPDGKLVAAGNAGFADAFGLELLAGYNSDGSLDTTFGTAGFVPTASFRYASGMALQTDGKVVLAGAAPTGASAIVLSRYDGTCAGPDGDGDGIPDACDPCTLPGGVSHPHVTIQGLPTSGHESLKMTAHLVLAGSPQLNPPSTGIRVRLEDATGRVVLDVGLPGNSSPLAVVPGWKTRGGHVFVYRDMSGVPRYGGIGQATVNVGANGKVVVSIVGRKGSYAIDASQLPLKATVILTTPRASAGQCGELLFPGPPPAPSCRSGLGRISCH